MDDELITKKQFIKIDLELVLDCVMPYIQDPDDLNSLSLVSKNFYDIDSKTRKHLTVHVHYLPDPKRLSLRFPNLESLTLESFFHGKDCGLKSNIPVTPWIQEIAVKFTRLESLSFRKMVVSTSDLQLLAKTRGANLKSLEIRGCEMFSEDGLTDIARYCVDLRSLSLQKNYIENDYKPNGKWLHELAMRNTVMESLDFHSPFDRYDMKDITRLAKKCSKSLVSLNIYQRSLSDFRKVIKHAKKLDYFGCGIIDEDWDYNGFKFPPNIGGLRIQDVYPDSFPILHPYLNQLRELDLLYAKREYDCQCFLFERCPNIEVLVAQDVCEDEGLQVIAQFCKKLRKLSHYGSVTQLGLIALAQGCHNLVYLEVNCVDISNEALECVGTHLKTLREFRIYYWDEDEAGIRDSPLDNGVRAMLMGCSKLETLKLSSVELTDVGLGYIGKYGHNLRYVYLWNIGESDVGLLELSKGCPRLRKLRLRCCPFSEQAVSASVFTINHSIRYISVDRGFGNDMVHTRPMVCAEMKESRKRKPKKLNVQG